MIPQARLRNCLSYLKDSLQFPVSLPFPFVWIALTDSTGCDDCIQSYNVLAFTQNRLVIFAQRSVLYSLPHNFKATVRDNFCAIAVDRLVDGHREVLAPEGVPMLA